MTATARREGDYVILTVPIEEVHELRVALQPCPCKSTKSHATTRIRERFVRGLGMAIEGKKKTARIEQGDK